MSGSLESRLDKAAKAVEWQVSKPNLKDPQVNDEYRELMTGDLLSERQKEVIRLSMRSNLLTGALWGFNHLRGRDNEISYVVNEAYDQIFKEKE